ncbi:MAG: hypothetical protein A2X94_14570 [Bdellovibrionales bacterium GWB1_55_8]|nr:MAG: hypothetical protein A2X94_14570 [Bdellovibrionales bacterium GWB1_55_8]
MSLDSDVALIGTGAATLVAAHHLMQRGLSVLLLNPDGDFFLEDSELSFDPLWLPSSGASEVSAMGGIERILRNTPERALAELQPSFPGTVETWSSDSFASAGFRDPEAPYLRQRGRLWVVSPGEEPGLWEKLEELYVDCLDRDLNPQLLDGLPALAKFPGFAGRALDYRGLWIPKFCDVDVVRYRNGVLEFVRERLGDQKVICGATQVEPMPEGIRFTSLQGPKTARIRLGVLAFWTPRATQWVISQAKQNNSRPVLPQGLRVIEQWALVSRDSLDPKAIAALQDLVVCAQTSGAPPASTVDETDVGLFRLEVLRRGPLLPVDVISPQEHGASWASGESFEALRTLCLDFLGWDRFSIRSMRPRAILEWENPSPWKISDGALPVIVIPGCDGPLVDAVGAGRRAAELFAEEGLLS